MLVTEPKVDLVPKAKVIKAGQGHLTEQDLEVLAHALSESGVIVIPTDTVYGIACNPFDPIAVKKVYALKGRDYKKALPILLGSGHQLSLVAEPAPKEADRFINTFWPGPLTLVMKTAPMALQASRGKDTIAIRVPDHGAVKQLLDKIKLPLAATSANKSGHVSMKTGDDVVKAFENDVDVIVDGGECHWRLESSVVDVTHYPFTVLRQGAVTKSELYEELTKT